MRYSSYPPYDSRLRYLFISGLPPRTAQILSGVQSSKDEILNVLKTQDKCQSFEPQGSLGLLTGLQAIGYELHGAVCFGVICGI